MKLYKWSGVQDIIILPFIYNPLKIDSYKIIWGDKISGEWEPANISRDSFELYNPIENLKLPPIVYRSLVSFIWGKKFSDFLNKDPK